MKTVKQQIIERFHDLEMQALEVGMMPSVIVSVGIDPQNRTTYQYISVVSGLPDAVMVKEALEDALEMITNQINKHK